MLFSYSSYGALNQKKLPISLILSFLEIGEKVS
jgi:hypothetical protein